MSPQQVVPISSPACTPGTGPGGWQMDQKGHFWVLLMVENCCYCQQAAVYIPSLPLQPRRGPCGAQRKVLQLDELFISSNSPNWVSRNLYFYAYLKNVSVTSVKCTQNKLCPKKHLFAVYSKSPLKPRFLVHDFFRVPFLLKSGLHF